MAIPQRTLPHTDLRHHEVGHHCLSPSPLRRGRLAALQTIRESPPLTNDPTVT